MRNGEARVGVIGYGLAGEVFHAPLIAATPGLLMTAVVTSDPQRAERVASRYPGTDVVRDADALWKRAADLDLVVIASPNRTHVTLARQALQAGLAVVVDKPLAASAAEGTALIEEARDLGLLLTVFQNRRWDGDFLTARKLVQGGLLGEVYRFESRFDRWRPVPKPGWRQSGAAEDAGGLLYDLGAHLIDQALFLFGPVAEVYAEVDRRRPGTQVDDDTFLALTHRSGVHSHLWMSTTAAQAGPRFRLLGSEAAYTKHGLDVQEEALRAGGRPDLPGWGEEPEERWGSLGVGDEARPVRTEAGAYQRFYEGVAAALREGAPLPVDPADAVAGLRIVEAARRAAAERAVIALDRVT